MPRGYYPFVAPSVVPDTPSEAGIAANAFTTGLKAYQAEEQRRQDQKNIDAQNDLAKRRNDIEQGHLDLEREQFAAGQENAGITRQRLLGEAGLQETPRRAAMFEQPTAGPATLPFTSPSVFAHHDDTAPLVDPEMSSPFQGSPGVRTGSMPTTAPTHFLDAVEQGTPPAAAGGLRFSSPAAPAQPNVPASPPLVATRQLGFSGGEIQPVEDRERQKVDLEAQRHTQLVQGRAAALKRVFPDEKDARGNVTRAGISDADANTIAQSDLSDELVRGALSQRSVYLAHYLSGKATFSDVVSALRQASHDAEDPMLTDEEHVEARQRLRDIWPQVYLLGHIRGQPNPEQPIPTGRPFMANPPTRRRGATGVNVPSIDFNALDRIAGDQTMTDDQKTQAVIQMLGPAPASAGQR